eukprot:2516106-Prorocentrum_lima.AAC.1
MLACMRAAWMGGVWGIPADQDGLQSQLRSEFRRTFGFPADRCERRAGSEHDTPKTLAVVQAKA